MEHWRNKSLNSIITKINGETIVEKWRNCRICLQNGSIYDYTGYYMVSSFGRVKSVGRKVYFINRWKQNCVRRTIDKILKPNKTNMGYLRQTLTKGDGFEIAYSIHRLVLSSFKGNPRQLPQINHEDGVKTNNYIKNLKWCDQEYNQKHAYETGLNVPRKGGDSPGAKPVYAEIGGRKIKYNSIIEATSDLKIAKSTIRNSINRNRMVKLGNCKGYKFYDA